MDWKNRRYFKIILDPWNKEEELNAIKSLKGIKISPYKYLEKMPDETEKRGYYTYLISTSLSSGDYIEKKLREIIKPSGFSLVDEIKRDVSKKYFDVWGNEMPYRRCEMNPNKRCNHCMDC